MPKKLTCDRCGFELTDKENISIALEGEAAWQMAARARGAKARGVIPCKYFAHCGGEMQTVKKRSRWMAKLTGSKEESR